MRRDATVREKGRRDGERGRDATVREKGRRDGAGSPPATIAEFSLGDIDYYDVSLVDGFNLPIVVQPLGGKGNCSTTGCDADLRPNCPPELALKSDGKIIACRSACDVFNKDEYCCRGEFNTPMACLATDYSRMFKTACPAASSYAYDNVTTIITCTASVTDYMVSFCSSRNQTECTYHDNKLICNGAIGMMWNKLLIAVAAAIIIPVFM
ncbi:hypothetical protein ACS0TY_011614 [Phlomoides rotata]